MRLVWATLAWWNLDSLAHIPELPGGHWTVRLDCWVEKSTNQWMIKPPSKEMVRLYSDFLPAPHPTVARNTPNFLQGQKCAWCVKQIYPLFLEP